MIVAPVMLLVIMGFGELAYQGYMQSVLSGAIQKAGRDSALQGNETTPRNDAIDAQVMTMIHRLSSTATYTSKRLNYASFQAVAPEPFEDNNLNKVYDAATECFTDVNGNKQWDVEPGLKGQGGANDVVVYEMNVTSPQIFPTTALFGFPEKQTISARTVLKNQPYRQQQAFAPTKICPR